MTRVVTLTSEHNDKSVFGFALWVFAWSCFLVYLIWVTVDNEVLSLHGMKWLPSKYWALALPGCLVVFLCSYGVIYALIGMSVNPAPTSMDSLKDEFSNVMDHFLQLSTTVNRSFLQACYMKDPSHLSRIDLLLSHKNVEASKRTISFPIFASPTDSSGIGNTDTDVIPARVGASAQFGHSFPQGSPHNDESSSLDTPRTVDNFQLPAIGDIPWSLANQLIHLHPNLPQSQRKSLFQGHAL